MNERYIKLYTKLFKENFANKPIYLTVWIYLLCNASTNKYKQLEAGELIITNRKLAKLFNYSEKHIRLIINFFVSEDMISKTRLKNSTKIKILNWEKYQSVERERETAVNRSTGKSKKASSRAINNIIDNDDY